MRAVQCGDKGVRDGNADMVWALHIQQTLRWFT